MTAALRYSTPSRSDSTAPPTEAITPIHQNPTGEAIAPEPEACGLSLPPEFEAPFHPGDSALKIQCAQFVPGTDAELLQRISTTRSRHTVQVLGGKIRAKILLHDVLYGPVRGI